MSDYDIAIVGGGLVGLSLAAALSAQQKRVVLIERYSLDIDANDSAESFDERCVALSLSSQQFFQKLGLWDEVAAQAAPIQSIHVSDQGRFGATRLNADDYDEPALGWVVPNRVVGRALSHAVKQSETVCLPHTTVVATEVTESGRTLVLQAPDGEQKTITASMLIAADGPQSPLREMLGIPAATHNYNASAVVANITTNIESNPTAYERFTEFGPLALLPLPSSANSAASRYNLVWSIPAERVAEIADLDNAAFEQAISAAIGSRIGAITRAGNRATFPLFKVAAESIIADKACLVGSCAHHLHPVAGQAFNLALRDVNALQSSLLNAETMDAALLNYAYLRKQDREQLLNATHSMLDVFASKLLPVKAGRALGLIGLDVSSSLKRAFVRRATGLSHP